MNGKVLAMLLLVSFIVLSESWGRRRRGARRRRAWRKISYFAKKAAYVAKKAVKGVKKAIPHVQKAIEVGSALGDNKETDEAVAYLKTLQEQDQDLFQNVINEMEGEMVAEFGEDEAAKNMERLNDLVEASENDLDM